MQDQHFYNKKYFFSYTTDYICLIDTNIDKQSFDRDIKNLDKGAKVISYN